MASTKRRWVSGGKDRLLVGRVAKRRFGPVTVAKAYRLLHAIFESRSMIGGPPEPCRIEGADRRTRQSAR